MPGILALLLAKMAGLGTVVKTAIAAGTAVVTMGVAGGATGVLALPGGGDPSAVAQSAIDRATADVGRSVANPVSPTTAGGAATQATTGVSVTTPAASTSARTRTTLAPTTVTPTGATTPARAAASNGTVPTVPTVPALPALPTCVANLVPTAGTVPDPALLVTRLPACIRSVVSARLSLDTIQRAIGSANLPANVSACLSAVVGAVPGFAGGDLSGLPRLLSTCLGIGSVPGIGSIPGAGSIPGFGSIPGLGSGLRSGR